MINKIVLCGKRLVTWLVTKKGFAVLVNTFEVNRKIFLVDNILTALGTNHLWINFNKNIGASNTLQTINLRLHQVFTHLHQAIPSWSNRSLVPENGLFGLSECFIWVSYLAWSISIGSGSGASTTFSWWCNIIIVTQSFSTNVTKQTSGLVVDEVTTSLAMPSWRRLWSNEISFCHLPQPLQCYAVQGRRELPRFSSVKLRCH